MILLTTLLPSTSLPSTLSIWEILSFDSFAHAFMFCVLCFLMIVGLTKQFTYPHLHHYAIRASLVISTSFGIAIELMQHFFIYGRQGDIVDIMANTIGCLLGIVLFKWIYIW
ncbi:vanz family protein [Pontibacter korlensis]|uniref:Vanz family protein n=1 Tax=Pontibacter korlensis TaxID=400092 RepID=A0A0E3ZJA8_9BACT|nr:vanz family protein [Pontibacter korlensis]